MSVMVGIALGGGGARGLAHVGVLKVLEEEGISLRSLASGSLIPGSLLRGSSLKCRFVREPPKRPTEVSYLPQRQNIIPSMAWFTEPKFNSTASVSGSAEAHTNLTCPQPPHHSLLNFRPSLFSIPSISHRYDKRPKQYALRLSFPERLSIAERLLSYIFTLLSHLWLDL